MAKFGLFTRADAHAAAKTKSPRGGMSLESLHRLGVKVVRNMNPLARTPDMPPSGDSSPSIYVLGEAPDFDEDSAGRAAAGKAGRLLRSLLPKSGVRYNFCCRTLPPKDRAPNWTELECFRPSVVEDIERTKPALILAVGYLASEWLCPVNKQIASMRGRRLAVKVGSHACWAFPIMQPSFVLKVQDNDRMKPPGPALRQVLESDVAKAITLSSAAAPVIIDEAWCRRSIKVVDTPDDAVRALRWLKANGGRVMGGDLETNHLRPYVPGAKILTMAFGDKERVYSFPFAHPEADWSNKSRARVAEALKELLLTDRHFVFHNLSFDLEWLVWLFGERLAHSCLWDDTMQQAYVLDSREKCHSLDFLSITKLGLRLKAISGVDRKQLEHTKLSKVLDYNGLDVPSMLELFRRQKRELKQQSGLMESYEIHQLRKVPAIVLAQSRGFPVSQRRVAKLIKEFSRKLKDTEAAISAAPEVKKFNRMFGTFNPGAPDQVAVMFRDLLKRSEGSRRSGEYSTDESVLKAIGTPLALSIIDYRQFSNKMLGTYLLPLSREYKKSVVYPDGRVHTNFNSTFTVSGRLSSDDPNLQNYPIRTLVGRQIRRVFVADNDCYLLAVDYGQLEYRVIGWASKDRNVVTSTFEGYDVHMHWAERVARVYPKIVKARHGSLKPEAMKKFRSEIKNQLVFPAFYLAYMESIAKALDGIPERIFSPLFDEFWEYFNGVRSWQDSVKLACVDPGYVATLTGRRRYMPMNLNEAVNHPIQGTGSDIVTDAMALLSFKALEEEKPHLQPLLNIHDDLTFMVPKNKVDEAVADIVEVICEPRFEFINTPIQAEIKLGKDWCNMTEVCKCETPREVLPCPTK